MSDATPLYSSQIKCPLCETQVEYTKVRTKSVKITRQDTDFCPWYEGENPLLYEVVVCPECGYGAHVTTFETLNKYEKEKIREKITKRWKKRSFHGQRTLEQALEVFKIALLNLYEMDAPSSEIAKICMRIGWIYRYKANEDMEKKFLEHALKYYQLAYQNEDLSRGKLDEYTCMFIIGDLYKRLGQHVESSQWFSRLIMCYSDPAQKDKIPQRLIETARELFHETKELAAAEKSKGA